MNSHHLYLLLFLGIALFFTGAYGFLTRKNMISMLMSLELMLNSVALNFVVFNKYLFPAQAEGLFFSLFIITIAAAEAALAIAIIISIYRRFKSIDADEIDTMNL